MAFLCDTIFSLLHGLVPPFLLPNNCPLKCAWHAVGNVGGVNGYRKSIVEVVHRSLGVIIDLLRFLVSRFPLIHNVNHAFFGRECDPDLE